MELEDSEEEEQVNLLLLLLLLFISFSFFLAWRLHQGGAFNKVETRPSGHARHL